MQFKHPEILYALALLIIPIIVHLFQLRKFKNVPFTNVKFLKKVELQTRKSSKLKKTLLLITRLLALSFLIFAFAQPFLGTSNEQAPTKTIIYLDNSFSMQAKGSDGELLKRAAQQLIEKSKGEITLFTNNQIYENLTSTELKSKLLAISYDPIPTPFSSVLLKIKNLLSKSKDSYIIFLISDFQNVKGFNEIINDSIHHYYISALHSKDPSNVAIDSAYMLSANNEQETLRVVLNSYGKVTDEVALSLTSENALIGRSSVQFKDQSSKASVDFQLPNEKNFKGILTIEDASLDFDNQLYLVVHKPELIKVLSIGEEANYLSKIYTNDEFIFSSVTPNTLDYNLLQEQHLLILNELEDIPLSLAEPLSLILERGGNVVIIPSEGADTNNYNKFFSGITPLNFAPKIPNELAVTNINFSHPFIKSAFEKSVSNFQYPNVKSYFPLNIPNKYAILSYENGHDFLTDIPVQSGHIYLFSSALNTENSNFQNSPLIVPVFYNFGLYSVNTMDLYYTIGRENSIDIPLTLNKDDVLHIVSDTEDFIPLQNITAKQVEITLKNNPSNSGYASVQHATNKVRDIAFNYDRAESNISVPVKLEELSEGTHVHLNNSVSDAFSALEDNYKTSNLWQYFLIIAFLWLLLEVILLKYLKP